MLAMQEGGLQALSHILTYTRVPDRFGIGKFLHHKLLTAMQLFLERKLSRLVEHHGVSACCGMTL